MIDRGRSAGKEEQKRGSGHSTDNVQRVTRLNQDSQGLWVTMVNIPAQLYTRPNVIGFERNLGLRHKPFFFWPGLEVEGLRVGSLPCRGRELRRSATLVMIHGIQ
jgi:hypothetical protein